MSRIGERKLILPEGIKLELTKSYLLLSKGDKSRKIPYNGKFLEIKCESSSISVIRKDQSKFSNMLQGTINSLICGAIVGLDRGFSRKLIIEGVGYKALMEDRVLLLYLGFSKERKVVIPQEVEISIKGTKEIFLSSHNKELLGEIAALIKKQRKAEPYKGKGIRIEGEEIIRKQGKSIEGGGKK